MTTRTSGFDWQACDDEIGGREEDGRTFTGTRVATVTAPAGDGGSTRWEVIAGEGGDLVVLETTVADGRAARTRWWGLPPWRAYPDALLAECRSPEEARAWLGVPLVEPVEGGAWWRHFEAIEQAYEDERRREEAEERDAAEWDEMGYPDADQTGARPVGPFRPVALDDLPEATLAGLERALAALARTLPLEVGRWEPVAAAARDHDVYDRGVDLFGGADWRVVATVGWAGRPALVVGSFRTDEVSEPEPERMALALVAPASREDAGDVATRDEVHGVELPKAQ